MTKEEKKEQHDLAEVRANMKAYLKTLSKNELVRTVFEQLDLYLMERHARKLLEAQLNLINPQTEQIAQNPENT